MASHPNARIAASLAHAEYQRSQFRTPEIPKHVNLRDERQTERRPKFPSMERTPPPPPLPPKPQPPRKSSASRRRDSEGDHVSAMATFDSEGRDSNRPPVHRTMSGPHPASVPPPVPPRESKAVAKGYEERDAKPTASAAADDEEGAFAQDAFNPKDLFFVLMGVTGAGKSTFISLLSEEKVEIGHELQSKTKRVSKHKFYCPDGRKAWLIDTPGFDDTERPNVEILNEIVLSLTKIYGLGARISGLIYLHRITDPRMPGSAVKNLKIFSLLTGPAAMPIVRLVSTRWNEVDPMGPDFEKAERLEKQLISSDKFWAPLLQAQAKTLRYTGDWASAISIISSLLEYKGKLPALAIQTEMVDQSLPLAKTGAGKFIGAEDETIRKHYEEEIRKLQQERKQALEDKDHQAAELFAAEEKEYQLRRDNMARAQTQLNVDYRALNEQAYEALLRQSETESEDKMAAQNRQHRKEMARLRAEMDQKQNAQQRQQSFQEYERIKSIVRGYEDELRASEGELQHLKKKNNKLKRGSSVLDWLMWWP